jgi:predicted Zn-dependent peptidase
LPVSWDLSTLENGLRVVTTPIPTTQAVSTSIFVGVGSRSERAEVNGVTHFLEHMVFKGTERRPDSMLVASAIEGAGGSLNAYTNKEFTCYWNIVPYTRFAEAFDVAADMLLNSLLDQVEIDRERTVVQQELKRNRDNPAAWAARLIGQSVYGEQPCGRDVGGTVEIVEVLQRPDFIEHIGAWYKPSNIVVSVAGNVTHPQVMELARPAFAAMEPGDLPGVVPYDAGISGSRVTTDSRDVDQCSMYLGIGMFGRSDPDRYAIRVLNDVLGAGMSSRLFREVRERRGLAYSVGSGYGYLADAGVFTISAGVDRERLAETISVCLQEARKMTSESVETDELRRAKDHTIGRFRLGLETAHALGQRHGEQLITRDGIEEIDDFVARIEGITPDELVAVGKRVFDEGRLHCSVVGPRLDETEIAAAIASA